MNIELQLREHLVLQDPGTQFTDSVMARVGDAPRGSGDGIVRLADERARRRSRRIILLGVLVAGAAAAMLALLLGGDGNEAAVQLAPPPPVVVAAATAVPAEQPVIEPPAAAKPPPAARQIAPPASTFTVRVKPLANPGNLVAGVELAQKFRDRLIAQLRAVPNLVLVDPADGGNGTVDYEVRLRLENSPGIVQEVLGDAAAAMHSVLVDAGPPARFATLDARIAAEAQMSPAELQRRQRNIQMLRVGALVRGGLPMSVSLIDQSVMPTPAGTDGVERGARDVVRKLRNDIFPVDAAFKQANLATLRNRLLPYDQRLTAQSDLLQLERRDQYSSMDAEVIRAGADLALSEPGHVLATLAWENMLVTHHPELIPQIARALDIAPDTNFRLRLIKFLASDFAGNPAARKVLEIAARENGQPVVRMAALREIQGDEKWHAFVAASLADTSLPDLQRLQPIADMADPAQQQATVRLALDDKALRELIALAVKVADSGNSVQAMNAILALRSVDSPALADRLIEFVRTPAPGPTELKRMLSMNVKTAAIGVAATRFPDDRRFHASLEEISASSDAQLSAWARDQLEMLEASTNPAARKALLDKMLQDILPAK